MVRTIVDQIEKEMFRVYGKVDNAYKNKFRSLIANISNMNNNVNKLLELFIFIFNTLFLLW